jgi:hypothetical protein
MPQRDVYHDVVRSALLGDPAVEIPRAIALDVGRIAGRGWAVVELNEAWASGRYGCDPTLVLPVLQRAVGRASHP